MSRVIQEITDIRKSFNKYVGPIAQATIGERKQALKKAAFESLQNFKSLFHAMLSSSDHYDPNKDVLNFYAFRKLIASNPKAFAGKVAAPKVASASELKRVIDEIIIQFKYMIENNNMWEMLWEGERPKRERASQLLFFAIADMFCKANNIDLSPETNMGGGPVDFKFSKGYTNRILVEIKLSKGQVVHGYEKQLEVYKKASKTDSAVLLIMNVGLLGSKLTTIKQLQKDLRSKGQRASDIIVVDARRKRSASKS